MQRALNYDRSPDLSASLRCFLAAAAFGIAAGLLLLWQGPQALASRWTPAALALAHLAVLGVLATTIIGALFQIIPVVTGMPIPGTVLLLPVVHALLAAGTLALAGAFLLGLPVLHGMAATALGIGLGLFLAMVAWGLWRYRNEHPDGARTLLVPVRLALAFLLPTVLAGMALALARAGHPGALVGLAHLPTPTDLHAAWGLAGWIGLLLMGVAFQVIPLFQVTEPYPSWARRWLAPGLALALLAWTGTTLLAAPSITWLLTIMAWLGLAAFAIVTLRLLRTRKRPTPDTTTRFWYVSLWCLLLAAGLQITGLPSAIPALGMLTGVLYIAGFAGSAVNGMLYTIVPFLVWLHAHRHANAQRPQMPKMREIIPAHRTMGQFRLSLAALGGLAAACLWPDTLARPAGLLTAASWLWLLLNLLQARRVYRQALASLRAPSR